MRTKLYTTLYKCPLCCYTRQDFESKIGRLEYSIGKYERLIRATVPIRLNLDEESKFYLLLSFDLKSAP